MAWPSHTSERRPWRQVNRAGPKADRMFSEVEVALPPKIAGLDAAPLVPSSAHLGRAAGSIAVLEAHSTAALSGLLRYVESVASSIIEGIEASLQDYVRALSGVRSNPAAVAMAAATGALDLLVDAVPVGGSLSLDDVLRAHRELMRTDAHESAYAGRVRDVQNWIGGSDYSPRDALFIPPPPETVGDYLDDLMTFVNRSDMPALVQAAVAHAQFESIHPFTDGNGRIGRALVNSVLRRRGVTTTVVVPIASAIAVQRDRYFSILNNYRRGDALPLVSAFVSAAHVAAEESRSTADRLAQLPGEWADSLGRVRAGGAVALLLDALPAVPVVSADDVERLTGGGRLYSMLPKLVETGILVPLTDRKRDQIWGAIDVLDELDDLNRRIGRRALAGP